jgi:hypothetical protein
VFGGGAVLDDKTVKKGLTETVTFEQKPASSEKMNSINIWGEVCQATGTASKRA